MQESLRVEAAPPVKESDLILPEKKKPKTPAKVEAAASPPAKVEAAASPALPLTLTNFREAFLTERKTRPKDVLRARICAQVLKDEKVGRVPPPGTMLFGGSDSPSRMRWAFKFVESVLSDLETPDTVLLDPYTELPMNCEDISFNRVFENEAHHDGPDQQYELCQASSQGLLAARGRDGYANDASAAGAQRRAALVRAPPLMFTRKNILSALTCFDFTHAKLTLDGKIRHNVLEDERLMSDEVAPSKRRTHPPGRKLFGGDTTAERKAWVIDHMLAACAALPEDEVLRCPKRGQPLYLSGSQGYTFQRVNPTQTHHDGEGQLTFLSREANSAEQRNHERECPKCGQHVGTS